MIPRVLDRDVAATLTDDHNEFGLVVATTAADRDVGGWTDEARGELGEHERARRRLDAALVGVGLVVEADAEHLLWAGHGRAKHDVGERAGRLTVVERRREFRQHIGQSEGVHRIGGAAQCLEVVIGVAGDEHCSPLDVAESESHSVVPLCVLSRFRRSLR